MDATGEGRTATALFRYSPRCGGGNLARHTHMRRLCAALLLFLRLAACASTRRFNAPVQNAGVHTRSAPQSNASRRLHLLATPPASFGIAPQAPPLQYLRERCAARYRLRCGYSTACATVCCCRLLGRPHLRRTVQTYCGKISAYNRTTRAVGADQRVKRQRHQAPSGCAGATPRGRRCRHCRAARRCCGAGVMAYRALHIRTCSSATRYDHQCGAVWRAAGSQAARHLGIFCLGTSIDAIARRRTRTAY